MNHTKTIIYAALISATAGIGACQSENGSNQATQAANDAAAEPAATVEDKNSSTSPGKPTAPISMSYEVIGNAIVGRPVSINVVVTSPAGPVNVQYSIIDRSALMFQPGQVERLEIADPSSGSVRQLSVVPQREGRLYVNVSAEVQTAGGAMIRSMAIPVKVGSAPEEPTINGELKEAPDGETVISMPAQGSN